MRLLISLGVAAALVCPGLVIAASCRDAAAPAIVSPATAVAAKCLSTITKTASAFVKAKMSTEGKCLQQADPAACPNAKDDAKIRKAANKAIDKVASACADNAVQAGLASAYGTTGDETKIASCVLSQHNATAAVMVGLSNGAPSPYSANSDRAKCASALSSSAAKMVASVLKTINKCVDGQLKAGNLSDLGPVCVGSWSAGSYVAPSNAKAADKIEGAIAKAEDSIDGSCGSIPSGTLGTIFACEGATSAAALKDCIVCRNWDGLVDILGQQYSEPVGTTFVDNGPGALQTAVDAASPGDKLLIESGTYQETVNIPIDDLQLVGCGAATNARPIIEPPTSGGPFPNGIFAASQSNLVFQSLEVFNWDENGIFVTGGDA